MANTTKGILLGNSSLRQMFQPMDTTSLAVWATSFIVESVLILIGNTLTIMTFLNFRLRQNRTFYFLINLALADFVVGCLTIPLFVYVFVHYFRGERVDSKIILAHNLIEVFTEYLALFSLALVSLERMYAVLWPIKHRRTPFHMYIVCIVITWVLAAVQPSLANSPSTQAKHIAYFMYFVFFTAALLLICICYVIVWSWVTCLRPSVVNRHHEVDRRLARTLVLVTVVSLVAWLPFQMITYVMALCKTCTGIPITVVYLSKILHYGNSVVNPILYCFRIPHFYQTTLSIMGMSRDQGNGERDSLELKRQGNCETSQLAGNSRWS